MNYSIIWYQDGNNWYLAYRESIGRCNCNIAKFKVKEIK